MTYYILSTTKKTGGTLLLHQLALDLINKGCLAYIYYQENSDLKKSIFFDIPIARPNDSSSSTVIIPEILTSCASAYTQSDVYIWWLSVDNYFRVKHLSFMKDIFNRYASLLLRKRLSLSSLIKYKHLAQSYYAKQFLSDNHIKSNILGDYLPPEYFEYTSQQGARKKNILYNPSKGYDVTSLLINNFPHFQFIPLVNLTTSQLIEVMSVSMIYIDFGHHPGKDRMPREAAICGCCIITGLRGSALNEVDVPIPSKYKLNPGSSSFLFTFESLVAEIIADYSNYSSDFAIYREMILNEKKSFSDNVDHIFLK